MDQYRTGSTAGARLTWHAAGWDCIRLRVAKLTLHSPTLYQYSRGNEWSPRAWYIPFPKMTIRNYEKDNHMACLHSVNDASCANISPSVCYSLPLWQCLHWKLFIDCYRLTNQHSAIVQDTFSTLIMVSTVIIRHKYKVHLPNQHAINQLLPVIQSQRVEMKGELM